MSDKSKEIEKKKCYTHEFRVFWPEVFEAKSFKNRPARFSLTAAFPKKADLSKPVDGETKSLQRIIDRAGIEKWGKEKYIKWRDAGKLKMPFTDGDDKDHLSYPNYKGYNYCTLSCKEKNPPIVVNEWGKEFKDRSKFYPGCYAWALVIAGAFDEEGSKGVKLTLLELQKTKDGDPLGQNKTTSFKSLKDDEDESDDDETENDEEDDEDDAGF